MGINGVFKFTHYLSYWDTGLLWNLPTTVFLFSFYFSFCAFLSERSSRDTLPQYFPLKTGYKKSPARSRAVFEDAYESMFL